MAYCFVVIACVIVRVEYIVCTAVICIITVWVERLLNVQTNSSFELRIIVFETKNVPVRQMNPFRACCFINCEDQLVYIIKTLKIKPYNFYNRQPFFHFLISPL